MCTINGGTRTTSLGNVGMGGMGCFTCTTSKVFTTVYNLCEITMATAKSPATNRDFFGRTVSTAMVKNALLANNVKKRCKAVVNMLTFGTVGSLLIFTKTSSC